MNNSFKNIAITGASGALGKAFVNNLAAIDVVETINVFSRSEENFHSEKIFTHLINYKNEDEIIEASKISSAKSSLDLVIVANGILHNELVFP